MRRAGSRDRKRATDRTVETPSYRYVLNMELMDFTGSSYVSMFNDDAEKLLGVTAAQLKDSRLRGVLDLTKEWNKVCDTQLITGVTVVRTEYAKENPDIVANFLRDYEKSIKAAQTDVAGTAALCEETGVVAKKAIAQKALPQCNIVYRVGDEMKADVNAYLKVLYDASPAAVGGKLPDANFYYTKATPGQVFWKSVQRSFQ